MICVALATVAWADAPAEVTDAPLPLPELNPRPPRRPPAPRRTTAGFRSFMTAGTRAEVRYAYVLDTGGLSIGELTVRGQIGWPVVSVGVELAGTAAASDRWSGAALGNLVVDARLLFGRGSTHALGLRVTGGVGDRGDPYGPVAWWGTVPAATVPTTGVAIAWEGATDRWVWHAHTGLHVDSWWAVANVPELFDLGAIVATVQPLGGPFSVVAELEAQYSKSPFHARGLARWSGGGWTADLGLAGPIPAMFTDPTLQVIGSVRRGW